MCIQSRFLLILILCKFIVTTISKIYIDNEIQEQLLLEDLPDQETQDKQNPPSHGVTAAKDTSEQVEMTEKQSKEKKVTEGHNGPKLIQLPPKLAKTRKDLRK